MSISSQLNQDRIAELQERQEDVKRELKLLKGHRGICSRCGEEDDYANYGSEDPKLCGKCWDEKRIALARETFVPLIGLRVEDVIISSGVYPLQGLKLEGGHVLEVESDYDGDAYLDWTKRPRG